MIIIETIIYVALIIGLFLVCDNRYSRRYYVPLKVVCSTSFLVIFWINQCFSEKFGLMVWAVLACFLGDIMMALYNTYMRRPFFVLGIITFMIAHVALLNYMCRVKPNTSPWVFILAAAPCILLFGMVRWFRLHIGRLLWPCLIYCYFVSTMALKANQCALDGMPIIGIAGLLFLFSDVTILFLYFYHYRSKNKKRFVHYVNLGTYYLAILLFIFSLDY
ncbi:MAG: lysoplasmalogenase [Pseudobutyrivibrio sp.]|nr:lysoplasmalogenase [Pseudobutyrivibrio sp.]